MFWRVVEIAFGFLDFAILAQWGLEHRGETAHSDARDARRLYGLAICTAFGLVASQLQDCSYERELADANKVAEHADRVAAPRSLSREDAEALGHYLRSHVVGAISFQPNAADVDAVDFAAHLETPFRDAGWRVGAMNTMLNGATPDGVQLRVVDPEHPTASESSAIEGLRLAHANPSVAGGGSSEVIVISVGRKLSDR